MKRATKRKHSERKRRARDRLVRTLGHWLGLEPVDDESARDYVGRDLTDEKKPVDARRVLGVLGLVIVVALGLAALRIDLIRVRYALGDVLEREEKLLEEQRMLALRHRQLRDPNLLAVRAQKLGLTHPEVVLELDHIPVDGNIESEMASRSVRPEAGRSAAPPAAVLAARASGAHR